MIIKRIDGATRFLGAPKDYDNTKEEVTVGVLPVKIEHIGSLSFMVSAWEPTPEEIARIVKGAHVYLYVSAPQHPVVALKVCDA